MDKIDDLLKDKAINEIDDFVLPESFNNRIEELLENIDKEESKNKWYSQKKLLAMVACFAFVFLVGIKYKGILNPNLGRSDGVSKSAAENSISMADDTMGYSSENPSIANSYGGTIIDINEVENITIKILGEKSTYKWINKKEDIGMIISFIDSLEKIEITSENIQEWDILIQTSGATNHSIMFKDSILCVDDIWYEINKENVNEFINIYDELNYEEKDIKYCNF